MLSTAFVIGSFDSMSPQRNIAVSVLIFVAIMMELAFAAIVIAFPMMGTASLASTTAQAVVCSSPSPLLFAGILLLFVALAVMRKVTWHRAMVVVTIWTMLWDLERLNRRTWEAAERLCFPSESPAGESDARAPS